MGLQLVYYKSWIIKLKDAHKGDTCPFENARTLLELSTTGQNTPKLFY